MSVTVPSYKRHRFPPAIIAHAVWLYLRFSLSLRAVEEMLLERGIDVSYETLRRWIQKFGPIIARGLRRRQDRPGRIWHLDEVQVAIRGRKWWLWRAVDEHGLVLEEILQPRRDRKAARKLLRRLLKGNALPEIKRAAAAEVEFNMRGYRSPGDLQRFVSMHSAVRNRFVPSARRRPSAQALRYHRLEAFGVWREAAGLAA